MTAILTPARSATIVSTWWLDPIDRWRQAQRSTQFINWRALIHSFAREVESLVAHRLQGAGYKVELTTHKCPFDLWLNDCLRIEVKAATWSTRPDRPQFGHYQARIRNWESDILILDCRNGQDHFFVIPRAALGARRAIKITSYDVNTYAGQFAPWLENWPVIDSALAGAEPGARQLSLKEVSG